MLEDNSAAPPTPEEPVMPTEEEIAAQLEREIEEKQISFADYMKSKKRVALPTPITKARAADHDADQAQWATNSEFQKVDANFIVLKTTVAPVQKQAKTTVRPVTIDIQPPRFNNSASERPPREPRTGGDRPQGDRPQFSRPPRNDGEVRPPRGEPRGDREQRGDKRPERTDRAPKSDAIRVNKSATTSKPRAEKKEVNLNEMDFPSLG